MDLLNILLIPIFGLAGAFLYLGRGGDLINLKPDLLEDLVFCLPLAVVTFALGGGVLGSLLALALSTGMCRAGHGAWFDLGLNQNPEDKYSEERIISFFLKPIGKLLGFYENRVLYDSIGLAINGLFITLPFGLALLWYGEPLAAALISLVGLTKLLAYWIGWRVDTKYTSWFFGAAQGTGAGEALTGFFFYSLFATIWCVV